MPFLLFLLLLLLLTATTSTHTAAAPQFVDLRVTRGLGTKGYSAMRISAITHGPFNFTDFNFTYSAPFKYRWTAWPDPVRAHAQPNVPERWLHSALIHMTAPEQHFTVAGAPVTIRLPPINTGARGLIISDPCFTPPSGVQHWIDCRWSEQWQTFNRTLRLLEHSLAGHSNEANNVDYWMSLGDNFYDQNGAITDVLYASLSLAAKSKPMGMIIGNHDMWIEGGPSDGDQYDQHGNGMMQYYAVDPASSLHTEKFTEPGQFLDFSVDPDAVAKWNTSLNTASNLIFWHSYGDVAFIGVSGAFSEQELGPHLDAACQWLEHMEDPPNWLFLLGHWDKDTSQVGEHCDPCPHMATPEIYQRLRNTSGCQQFGNRFKYQDGHTHCNYIQEVDPLANNEAVGLMIGGSGMDGCSQYGFEYIDSDGESLEMYYFELENATGPSRAEEILTCIEEHGLPNCKQLGTLWFEGNASRTVF